jgi:hypothetical protein
MYTSSQKGDKPTTSARARGQLGKRPPSPSAEYVEAEGVGRKFLEVQNEEPEEKKDDENEAFMDDLMEDAAMNKREDETLESIMALLRREFQLPLNLQGGSGGVAEFAEELMANSNNLFIRGVLDATPVQTNIEGYIRHLKEKINLKKDQLISDGVITNDEWDRAVQKDPTFPLMVISQGKSQEDLATKVKELNAIVESPRFQPLNSAAAAALKIDTPIDSQLVGAQPPEFSQLPLPDIAPEPMEVQSDELEPDAPPPQPEIDLNQLTGGDEDEEDKRGDLPDDNAGDGDGGGDGGGGGDGDGGDGNDDGADETKNPEGYQNIVEQLDTLISRAKALLQRNVGESDATQIYQEFQRVKVQLLEKLKRAREAAENGAQIPGVNWDDIQSRINELQDILNELGNRLQQSQAIRDRFQVPHFLDTQTDFSNYYGVYIYNTMMTLVESFKNKFRRNPLAIGASTAAKARDLVLASSVTEVADEKKQEQEAYYNLLVELDDETYREEIKQVQARFVDGGVIDQAAKVVTDQVSNMLDSLVPSLADLYSFPVGARAGYYLQREAGERMYENDVADSQNIQVDRRFYEVPPSQQEEAKTSARNDIVWRKKDWPVKTGLFDQAITWALENGLERSPVEPTLILKRDLTLALEGILKHLQLVIYQYSPVRNEALGAIMSRNKDLEDHVRQSCKSVPSDQQQRVIPEYPQNDSPSVWSQIMRIVRGEQDPHEADIGYVLLKEDGTYMGIIQCLDGRANPELQTAMKRFPLETSDVGRDQGIPRITSMEQYFSSLDITFLCAQRLDQAPFLIRDKKPRNLGTLLMLWVLVQQLNAGYQGIRLEVVGQEDAKLPGKGMGLANTTVAAYYQRYFKFQRTSSLENFATSASLGFFHPGWEGYRISSLVQEEEKEPVQKKQKKKQKSKKKVVEEPELQIMYRPYPTSADLTDMIARLVQQTVESFP